MPASAIRRSARSLSAESDVTSGCYRLLAKTLLSHVSRITVWEGVHPVCHTESLRFMSILRPHFVIFLLLVGVSPRAEAGLPFMSETVSWDEDVLLADGQLLSVHKDGHLWARCMGTIRQRRPEKTDDSVFSQWPENQMGKQ